MTQAKGVLPRREDRGVLWKNPHTCGYFLWAWLDPAMDGAGAEGWFRQISPAVDALVARQHGEKVATAAVSVGPRFFSLDGATPRFAPAIDPPAAFRTANEGPRPTIPEVPGASAIDADLLFYVASVHEARVSRFLEALWATRPIVQRVAMERGYQRMDEREPFGYRDGIRNVRPRDARSSVAFVHRDGLQGDEPEWAEGGSYLMYVKCVQNPEAFAALGDDAARDAVVGRDREGRRLDRDSLEDDEPAAYGDVVPQNAHVRKSAPRGDRDDVQIFRRGLPFIEATPEGGVRVGLQFASFQASLDQFDVVFNDWIRDARFPVEGAGTDALLDPARALVTFEKAGAYFVLPHDERFLGATLFEEPRPSRRRTGRLLIRKRVIDPTDPSRRFDRAGFVFQVFDGTGSPVGKPFISNSAGRALAPEKLTLGQTYIVREIESRKVPNVPLTEQQVTMSRSHLDVLWVNQLTVPNSPYGG